MEQRSEPISRQHHRAQGMGGGRKLALALGIVLLAGAGWWYWRSTQAPVPAEPVAAPATPPAVAAADPVPEAPAAPAPEAAAPQAHPLEPAADAQGRPPLAAGDGAALAAAVSEFLGRERTLRYVATDDLARRLVATLDNLPRNQAVARLWPLHPVGGRMVVTQTDDGGLAIAPANAARYDGLVQFLAGIDMAQAGALYRRIYPVLQKTYEELGYPGQRFNDRLVQVIDHLLQTPEPAELPSLKLVQVQGQVAPKQPWLRYEFADGELQSLSAGQKILVRMGVAHTQRIKALLQAAKAQMVKG